MIAVALALLVFCDVVSAKLHFNDKISFVPQQFKEMKQAVKSYSTPSSYLVATFYQGLNCTGDFSAAGTAFGVCKLGGNSDDQPPMSQIYIAPETDNDDNFLNYSVRQFYTADCTGPFDDMPVRVEKSCMGGSMKVSYVNSSTPWKKFGNGLVIEYSPTIDMCTTKTIPNWNMTPLDFCQQIESNDSDAKSQKITSCSNGRFTTTQYLDTECKTFYANFDAKTAKCHYYNGDNDYETSLCALDGE